ncbi:NAD(P)-binding protein [Athelia psychrophila]|uniref:NAD(P)-binding protein n=1 Tax=Athelia psychrophila TaxID=1759441 RepID=A0A165YRF7_9AGAM|nr:NAD(P)-binding protein [Fibularhizoctonia sp. CBS 109695]
MSPSTNILVLGATGYLGGSIVSRLLEHPKAANFSITALVRSEPKAKVLETLGINAVLGSLGEHDKLETLVSQADVTIAADADDLAVTEAILRGLKRKFQDTGKAPILIHSSGTGVLMDSAMGMHTTDTIYSDTDIAQIESLPPTALHRNVDLAIVAADEAGYAKTHIILPPTIFGLATGKLVDLGIQNRHSIQIPGFIKYNMARGHVGIVGEGKNVWGVVAQSEVVDFYIILLDAVLSNPATSHGREGFYFTDNGEFTHREVVDAVSSALAARGVVKLAQPTPFAEDDFKQLPFVSYHFYVQIKLSSLEWPFMKLAFFGTNARSRSDRSRALGWNPTKTAKDMLASIQPEVDALIQKS